MHALAIAVHASISSVVPQNLDPSMSGLRIGLILLAILNLVSCRLCRAGGDDFQQ